MTGSRNSRERRTVEVLHGDEASQRRKTASRRSEAQSRTPAREKREASTAGEQVASLLISWNRQVPLPRGWPHATHVVEVLPGSAVSWIAANGGYENFVANRWGTGNWTLQEVAHTAKQISEINVIVPSRPAMTPHPVRLEDSPALPAPPPELETGLVSDEVWAKAWASSFIQDQLQKTPDVDIVRVYRLVVEELVANADLIRNQSFDMLIELTESIVRHAASRKATQRGLVRRELPRLGA
jgi:hypothetical protein